MYLDSVANYYEERKLDKILFEEELYIGASENGIVIGDYKVIDTYITCLIPEEEPKGRKTLAFTTIAECNDLFFEEAGISKNQLDVEVTEDDRCRYTILKDINIWEEEETKLAKSFAIVGIVAGLGIMTLVAVWIFEKVKLRSIQNELAH